MPPKLDPHTNTREEFTMAALQQPIPANADPKWKRLNETLKEIAQKLLEHDAMRENKVQPFMRPAANKNRVYFLWDSTTRLLSTLYAVPPQLQASSHWSAQLEETWSMECVVKSKYIASLMVDKAATDPMTVMLNQAMSQGGETVELGEDLTQLAQRLQDL